MIAELFKERSRRFTTRCAKYSRYVFNDHFILVLLLEIKLSFCKQGNGLKTLMDSGNRNWVRALEKKMIKEDMLQP